MITKRSLGRGGPQVGRLGYGAMVAEGYYGPAVEAEAITTIQHAIDAGMTMVDTADAYGNGNNEVVVGKAIAERRESVFLCTKFGIVFDPIESGRDLTTGWGFPLKINGSAKYARRCLDASLKRLNVNVIDLWYLHFPDPSTPIEESVSTMSQAVKEGKVRHLGLSNVTSDQVRRAHAIHPIAAVQYEYSLWRREAEVTLLPTLRELGIALVAWSPLGGGFLTGTVKTIEKGDFRESNPKLTGPNFAANRDRFAPLMEVAKNLNITPAQLALAWLLAQGDDIFPIPGTRKSDRVYENARAASVELDVKTLQKIDEIAPAGSAVGATLV